MKYYLFFFPIKNNKTMNGVRNLLSFFSLKILIIILLVIGHDKEAVFCCCCCDTK